MASPTSPSRPAWAVAGSSSALLSATSEIIADNALSVGDDVAQGLESLSTLPVGDITALVSATWAALTTPTAEACLASTPLEGDPRISSPEKAKLAANALCTVLLESTRLGAGPDTVRSLFVKHGVPLELSESLAAAYASNAPTLRALHAGPGLLLPRLVDLDWRLDYVVKSSKSGAVSQPAYLVRLTTACAGSAVLHHIQFTCSPPQLEDLLSKVTDATRAAAAASKEA